MTSRAPPKPDRYGNVGLKIPRELLDELVRVKIHPRETLGDVIARLLRRLETPPPPPP